MHTTWLEASAGSGKTTFLISQIPDAAQAVGKTLYLTFSNAAVAEMKSRLTEADNIEILTLHALAYKIILEKFPEKVIVTESFFERAQIELLKTEEFMLLLKMLDAQMLGQIDHDTDNLLAQKVYKLIKQKEQEIKDEQNGLYYEDLLTLALAILKDHANIDVFMKFFGNIKLILVDEAQDLSPAQWDFLFAILYEWKEINGRLIIASDPKQLIYEFQGASLKVFANKKAELKKISYVFEEKALNLSYRLPKKVCDFVNQIGGQFHDINFSQHTSGRLVDGDVEILEIKQLSDIISYIKSNNLPPDQVMVLFRQKTDENRKLAQEFFANGFLLNSPYVVQHPMIKDFQHLVRWLHDKRNTFSKAIVENVTKNLNLYENANYRDLLNLFDVWISDFGVLEYLRKKLGVATGFWLDILMRYCECYRYDFLDAINLDFEDKKNFYPNNAQHFTSGIFFNTIHSAKGKEANYVFLIEAERKSKFNSDTECLLYVAITRAKQRLIITNLETESEKVGSKWAELLFE